MPSRASRRPAASIVILAWNAWPMTRGCLDSLRDTVGVDDEVIVVDNGSTDGTLAALRAYPWVKVVRNDDNRGFAGGCNDGARGATRDVVVFLNNDTLLAGGWLDRLLAPFGDDATVTATGPRSNFASGLQMVEGTTYARHRMAGLRRFVDDWQHRHEGRREEVTRLVGFCLAVRRDAFERVGGFDERFGLGGYEDDDLCRRLVAEGGRLLVVHDAFVHHHGHATFDANGVNWAALEAQARKAFADKHDDATAAADHLLERFPGEPPVRRVVVLAPEGAPSVVAALRGSAVAAVVLADGDRHRIAAEDPEVVVAVGAGRGWSGLAQLDVPVVAWTPPGTSAPVGWFDIEAPAVDAPDAWVPWALDRVGRTPSFGCLLLRCRRALDLGLPEEAERAARVAERIRPGTAQVRNALAVCRFAVGDAEGAVRLLHEALAVDPDHPSAGENLAALRSTALS